MRVVQAQIQTVEEIYRLVWTAVTNKQPIVARIKGGSDCFALSVANYKIGLNSGIFLRF
jgi:hypothetical protein